MTYWVSVTGELDSFSHANDIFFSTHKLHLMDTSVFIVSSDSPRSSIFFWTSEAADDESIGLM